MLDYFYAFCERYGGKLNSWAWNKRWSNRTNGTGYRNNR